MYRYASLDCAVHTCTTGKYAAITPTTSIINGLDRTITVIAKHCIQLPEDGSLVIRYMLEQF